MSSDLTPIAAYDIFANGKSVPAPDLSPTPAQDAAYRWLHFDLTAKGVDDWLDAHLPPSAANALQELETRPRIEEVELAGPVSRLRSSLVGGVKHLPIRYKLTPA